MNEYIFSSRKDWSDPQQIRVTLALIHTSRSWYHNRRTSVDKIYPREILCKCDRDLYCVQNEHIYEFNKLLGFEAGAHSPFHTPTGSATWDVIQFRARTAILAAESRTQTMWACPINVRSCYQQISSPIKMLFILCFLSYLILHFRTYHCLGSKETTTWTTYAYSDCSVLCRESCRPCRWAVRLRGGVGPGVRWEIFCGSIQTMILLI